MDLRDIHFLAASATAGNFASAAKELGVHPSTVSRRIGRIEDELGLTLFERGRFGIRLTNGGKAVMTYVRRVLADIDALKHSGCGNGSGELGEIRLGVRMPPVGAPMRNLLAGWHKTHPEVALTIFELNEREIQAGLWERRLDAALMTSHALWPNAVSELLYRERIVAAIPHNHALVEYEALTWNLLRNEIVLVQGWDESQSARELFAAFMGSGIAFQAHAASKQSVFALVGAGIGVTLATMSQSEVTFPGVTYRSIDEENAWVGIELTWLPETESAALGCFVAYMRDEARSRQLI